LTLAATGCASAPRLGVELDLAAVYRTESGETVRADYYALSDGSLHFVKLVLPSGEALTLPAALSASGVRYTDDGRYLWWTKGDGAFLQRRADTGEWETVYADCRLDASGRSAIASP
jgi:membrane-bound inhibitor of C-type lysozyme